MQRGNQAGGGEHCGERLSSANTGRTIGYAKQKTRKQAKEVMFRRARGGSFTPGGRAPCFASGRLGYAIGDVHGRADLLERIVTRVLQDCASSDCGTPIVVFLGDYVDRGPESAAVIDYLLDLPFGVEWRFLMGNHDVAMTRFVDAPLPNRGWLAHGGLETLRSYGVWPLPRIGSSKNVILDAHAQLKGKLPQSHDSFLRSLERFVVQGDYVFVHAGVDARRTLDRQLDEDLLWGRQSLEDARPFSHVVVHGHTPANEPYLDHRRVGIDIGAYATGRICAARFAEETVAFLFAEADVAEPSLSDTGL